MTILTSHRWSLEIHHLCKGTSNSQANWLVNSFCDALRLAWSVKYDSTNLASIVPQVSMAMPHSGWRSQVEEFLLCPLWPAETGQSFLYDACPQFSKSGPILPYSASLYHDSIMTLPLLVLHSASCVWICHGSTFIWLTINSSTARWNFPSLVPRPLLSLGWGEGPGYEAKTFPVITSSLFWVENKYG